MSVKYLKNKLPSADNRFIHFSGPIEVDDGANDNTDLVSCSGDAKFNL